MVRNFFPLLDIRTRTEYNPTMITVTHNAHDIAKIANDPTQSIRTAVYVGPDEDYIEVWFNPMFGHRTFIRVDPIMGTRDDAWSKCVVDEAELLATPYGNFRTTDFGQRLHAMLFVRGWRVEEVMPYDGPVGDMEWRAYEKDRLF